MSHIFNTNLLYNCVSFTLKFDSKSIALSAGFTKHTIYWY